MSNSKEPKILIVGTVPYNKKSTSRAFETYFHGWKKENLAQVFSNPKAPVKGHCSTLFQITDQNLLKKRFSKKLDTGTIYNYKQLKAAEEEDSSSQIQSILFNKLYKIGSSKTPITYLLRKILWSKKYWCTEKFNTWLDDFKPDCVFLSFSDDFFILEIALYVAEKYNIPILSSIGDDYYFNSKFTLSPFYYIYKSAYRKLVEKVLRYNGSAIYIGNKIRDKYNEEFNLDGKTVYLTSEIQRKDFKEIEKNKIKISYCGNIRLGRNESLNDIGEALGLINSDYILDIYSNENVRNYYEVFKNNKNVKFHGSVPYTEVTNIMRESDIVIVVEGFEKKDIEITKYSLSTKVADSLASGSHIVAYGSIDCGAIEYIRNLNCASVCWKKNELVECLRNLIDNVEFQKKNYLNSVEVSKENHNLQKNAAIFRNMVNKVVREECKTNHERRFNFSNKFM